MGEREEGSHRGRRDGGPRRRRPRREPGRGTGERPGPCWRPHRPPGRRFCSDAPLRGVLAPAPGPAASACASWLVGSTCWARAAAGSTDHGAAGAGGESSGAHRPVGPGAPRADGERGLALGDTREVGVLRVGLQATRGVPDFAPPPAALPQVRRLPSVSRRAGLLPWRFSDTSVCPSCLGHGSGKTRGGSSAKGRPPRPPPPRPFTRRTCASLSEPNDESGANVDASKMWRDDREQFCRVARQLAQKSLGL